MFHITSVGEKNNCPAKKLLLSLCSKTVEPRNNSSHFDSIHYSATFRLSVKLEHISTPERVSAQGAAWRELWTSRHIQLCVFHGKWSNEILQTHVEGRNLVILFTVIYNGKQPSTAVPFVTHMLYPIMEQETIYNSGKIQYHAIWLMSLWMLPRPFVPGALKYFDTLCQ